MRHCAAIGILENNALVSLFSEVIVTSTFIVCLMQTILGENFDLFFTNGPDVNVAVAFDVINLRGRFLSKQQEKA